MRTLCTVVALAATLALAPRLIAQGPAQERAERRSGGPGEGLAARLQDLNLSAEQEAKIATIRKEARPKVEEAAKELAAVVKAEVEKVQNVLTSQQHERLQALKDERGERRIEGLAERIAHLRQLELTDAELTQIQAIRGEYRPKIEKALVGLRGILNDKQKSARAAALKAGKNRAEILAALDLTGEQKEKVSAIGSEVGTLVREELEKMREVFSAAQQEKLAELKDERHDHARDRLACAIANLKSLHLTEEQKNQIVAIRTEYRPKVHEAGNKLRATVREEVEAIVAVLKG